MKTTAIVILCLVILGGATAFTVVKKQNNEGGNGVMCTADAMQCPDGSWVGRSGPHCEFVCADEGNTSSATGGVGVTTGNGGDGGGRIAAGYVVGHVSIGPFCPVEQVGHPCTVPPEAYTSRSVVVYESNGTTVKEKVALDADGNYKIALGSSTYWLQIEPAGIGAGEKKKVVITSFQTSTVDFDIDTGIR